MPETLDLFRSMNNELAFIGTTLAKMTQTSIKGFGDNPLGSKSLIKR